jgi:hypothetical protein
MRNGSYVEQENRFLSTSEKTQMRRFYMGTGMGVKDGCIGVSVGGYALLCFARASHPIVDQ